MQSHEIFYLSCERTTYTFEEQIKESAMEEKNGGERVYLEVLGISF